MRDNQLELATHCRHGQKWIYLYSIPAWRHWFLFVFVLWFLGVQHVQAADGEAYLRLQVADPYVELHTGPGRGFPVYHVIERHDWIELIKRRTDWFRVKAKDGKEGWAYIDQIEQTLATPGRQTKFANVKRQDFRQRDVEFGVLAGDFEGAALMTVYSGYNFTENLSVELAVSQASGTFTNSILIDLNVQSTPFPGWRVSPFFTLGVGHLRNSPRATFLLAKETSDVTANAGIGVRAYLTRRFVFRGDVKQYVSFISDEDNGEFLEWKLGFSFFF
ncbi:MAG: hypothetical protein GXP08_02810 [Gammaproteobacteria bacterium]|nr:hypothetical protein [Gammaproteobacteria bacterium]